MRTALAVFYAHEALLAIYILLLLVLEFTIGNSCLNYAAIFLMLTLLLVAPWLNKKSFSLSIARSFLPVLLVPLVFSLSYKYVPKISPYYVDDLLIGIDADMFQTNPTEALMQIASPALTEWLQIAYVLFYFLPLAICARLFHRKQQREFLDATFLIVYGFLLSYIGYFFTPAVGPRYTLHDINAINHELPGLFFAEPLRDILTLLEGPMATNAFPSGHTDLTLCSLLLAWKYDKQLFKIILPIGISIIFATVYMRYHYVIDVLGGVIFFLFTAKTSRSLQLWFERQNARLSLSGSLAFQFYSKTREQ